MNQSVQQLEQRRKQLLAAFAALGDLRPGSISGIIRGCGKPSCHCALPDDPGHGPNLRLTYKVQGKTISAALPTPAAVRKAESEELNTRICQLRPLEDTLSAEEKKRPKRSSRRSPKK